jgi:hypothetical protein
MLEEARLSSMTVRVGMRIVKEEMVKGLCLLRLEIKNLGLG